jgi:hypothetical protein
MVALDRPAFYTQEAVALAIVGGYPVNEKAATE